MMKDISLSCEGGFHDQCQSCATCECYCHEKTVADYELAENERVRQRFVTIQEIAQAMSDRENFPPQMSAEEAKLRISEQFSSIHNYAGC